MCIKLRKRLPKFVYTSWQGAGHSLIVQNNVQR